MFALINGLNKKNLKKWDEEGFKCLPLKVSYFPTLVDNYVLAVSCVLLPVSIALWCVYTVLAVIPAFVGFLYLQTQPRPLDRLHGRGFNLYCTFCLPFAAIFMFIAYLWFGFVLFVSFITGLPITLIRLVVQPGVVQNNFKLLKPFWRGGAFNFPDAMRCHLGQADRHGFFKFGFGSPFLGGFASAYCHTPILKLMWTTNPWAYQLEIAHINQWTPPYADLTPHQVRHKTQTKVSRSRHRSEFYPELLKGRFIPHYPFGPSVGVDEALLGKDEGVVGSQYLNCHPKLYGHTRTVWAHEHDKMDSTNGLIPVYRVYLDYFAYHFLTGYVELNVTRVNGVEHPMWCIVPVHGKLGRDMYSFVNILFLPYMREALYATQALVDSDERDQQLKDLARRRSLRVQDLPPTHQRRRSSLSKVVNVVSVTVKHVLDAKETES